MEQKSAIAPTYRDLRPMRGAIITPTFPVYQDLPKRLVGLARQPDAVAAHVLATCAGYSYADESTVAMMMARLGMGEQCQCLKVSMSVDAMFICSTAFVVQSACGRVAILSYRGTEPVNFINWLTDADANPERLNLSFPFATGEVSVHGGFYRNVRATRHQVIAALERALEGKRIIDGTGTAPHPLEALYITGHSLGGAMAALAGVLLVTDRDRAPLADKLRAVYTYGQPMIGDPAMASACAEHPFLGRNVIRYVYEHDLVPELPPTLAGPFAHFGPELRYSGGLWALSKTPTAQLSRALQVFTTIPVEFATHQIPALRKLPFLQHSIYAHLPTHYISTLRPPDVVSEFGI